jgi:hypothetical protein
VKSRSLISRDFMYCPTSQQADQQRLPVVLGAKAIARSVLAGVFVFNAISSLPIQEQQAECFPNAARHLQSGGRFTIEIWVPELPKRPPHAQT